MAQQVILKDDIDGSEDGVETVTFSWEETNYEIDLSAGASQGTDSGGRRVAEFARRGARNGAEPLCPPEQRGTSRPCAPT